MYKCSIVVIDDIATVEDDIWPPKTNSIRFTGMR